VNRRPLPARAAGIAEVATSPILLLFSRDSVDAALGCMPAAYMVEHT